jgi:Mg-chelatase subunit ChlD
MNPVEDAVAAARELRSAGVPVLVIDTEEGPARTGLASTLAQELGGTYVELATLEAMPVANAVSAALGRTRASLTRRRTSSPKASPCSERKGGRV